MPTIWRRRQRRAGTARPDRASPARGAGRRLATIIVVLAALAASMLGVGRLVAAFGAGDQAPPAGIVTLAELTTQVTAAEWVKMDHDMTPDAPGYQMPPAMMPGMPTGDDQRLSVAITVVNTGDRTRPLRAAKEFTLRSENGRQWQLHSDTFADLPRLAPRNAVSGVLFFDLPPGELAESPVWLEWRHQDEAARLTIPLDGAAPPPHSHP